MDRVTVVQGDRTIETLLAVVELRGDRAFKRRKALRTPFVDQRTVEQRRALCEAEVRLNRELAPGIHLGVVDVQLPDGTTEPAVAMRRLDPRHALPALLADERVPRGEARDLGARLAQFHATVPTAPGATDVLERVAAANLAELAAAARGVVDVGRVDDLRALVLDGLARRRGDLQVRAARGLAVDGHGDLRAEHVYLLDDGPVVIDRLEFDPELRQADVAADLAFLTMDLERLGARHLTGALLAGYREAGGDPGDDALLSLLAAHRALVRAKVGCLREDAADATTHLELAGHLAWRAAWGGSVTVVCGPPACGKSTLATALARRTGWHVLSTDLARKQALGVRPTDRAPAEAYGAAETDRVYRRLGQEAAARAADGVIVDGTFGDRRRRGAFMEGAGASGLPVRFVECLVPAEELGRRARARMTDPERVSDADPRVASALAAAFEPLDEVPPDAHLPVRADRAPDALIASLSRQAWASAATS